MKIFFKVVLVFFLANLGCNNQRVNKNYIDSGLDANSIENAPSLEDILPPLSLSGKGGKAGFKDCIDHDKDGVCDNEDACPFGDDKKDSNKDGIPDGCNCGPRDFSVPPGASCKSDGACTLFVCDPKGTGVCLKKIIAAGTHTQNFCNAGSGELRCDGLVTCGLNGVDLCIHTKASDIECTEQVFINSFDLPQEFSPLLEDFTWFGYAVAVYGEYAATGNPTDALVKIYKYDETKHKLAKHSQISQFNHITNFGQAIDMYDEMLIIGGTDGFQIYEFIENQGWTLALDIFDQADGLGSSVAVYKDKLGNKFAAAGAPNRAGFNIYRHNGQNWLSLPKQIITDSGSLGFSLVLRDDKLIVSDPYFDTNVADNAGKIQIWRKKSNGIFELSVNYIEPVTRTTNDANFGYALDIHEQTGTIFVGSAPTTYNNSSLSGDFSNVFIYSDDGKNLLTKIQTITLPDPTLIDPSKQRGFGMALSVNNNNLLIGDSAFANNSNKGRALLFKKSLESGLWEEKDQINPSRFIDEQKFGWDVATFNNLVLIGAPDGLNAPGEGSNMYFYQLDSTDFKNTRADTDADTVFDIFDVCPGTDDNAPDLDKDGIPATCGDCNDHNNNVYPSSPCYNNDGNRCTINICNPNKSGSCIAVAQPDGNTHLPCNDTCALGSIACSSGVEYCVDESNNFSCLASTESTLGIENNDNQGSSISIWGNWAASGVPHADGTNNDEDDLGVVFVDHFSSSQSAQQDSPHPAFQIENPSTSPNGDIPTSSSSESFGASVSLWGPYLAVGAPNADSYPNVSDDDNAIENTGAVYLFEKTNSDDNDSWNNVPFQKIYAPIPKANASFGYAVSINENFLVVGEPNAPGGGFAYAYRLNPTQHPPSANLIGSLSLNIKQPSDLFGSSVSIAQDRSINIENGEAQTISNNPLFVVGAPGANSQSGAIAIYQIDAGADIVHKQNNQDIFAEQLGQNFGYSVSISSTTQLTIGKIAKNKSIGGVVVAGAPNTNSSGFHGVGAIYIGDAHDFTNTKRVILPDFVPFQNYMNFGWSVAFARDDGDAFIVGAPKYDADINIDLGLFAVYAITQSLISTTPADFAFDNFVTAKGYTENGSQAQFGYSVDINNNRIGIGAPFDDQDGNDRGSVRYFFFPH